VDRVPPGVQERQCIEYKVRQECRVDMKTGPVRRLDTVHQVKEQDTEEQEEIPCRELDALFRPRRIAIAGRGLIGIGSALDPSATLFITTAFFRKHINYKSYYIGMFSIYCRKYFYPECGRALFIIPAAGGFTNFRYQ
jgi:hypothetical protein